MPANWFCGALNSPRRRLEQDNPHGPGASSFAGVPRQSLQDTRDYGIAERFVATGDELVCITSTTTARRPSVRHGSPPPFFPASC